MDYDKVVKKIGGFGRYQHYCLFQKGRGIMKKLEIDRGGVTAFLVDQAGRS
jgi:hypothetical protein